MLGLLCLILNKIRTTINLKKASIDYLIEHPKSDLFDQDALNVVCRNSILILDDKWNVYVCIVRFENNKELDDCIYHYAGTTVILYSGHKVDVEYFKILNKTPWANVESEKRLSECINRLNDRIYQYES